MLLAKPTSYKPGKSAPQALNTLSGVTLKKPVCILSEVEK